MADRPRPHERDCGREAHGDLDRSRPVHVRRGRHHRVRPAGAGPGAGRLRIKAASIDTGDAKRDGHLRSPDFLDADKYPEIRFRSTKIERTGDNDWLARGDLRIRDMTKPVEVKVETLGVVEDPYVKQRVGFDATARFDRRDWGLVWNMPMPSGLLVGEQVKIEFSVEAIPEQTPAAG